MPFELQLREACCFSHYECLKHVSRTDNSPKINLDGVNIASSKREQTLIGAL